MLKQLKKQAGTSLLNLIATIGIIGTTTALTAGQIDDALAYARDARRQLDMHQIQIALELYFTDMNQYPVANTLAPTATGWNMLSAELTLEDVGDGPYISKIDLDPLDENGYEYKYKSDGQSYEIWYQQEKEGEKIVVKSL